MSTAQRRLWGIGTARTLRPHWMLHELGLDYETRAVLPRSAAMDDPELLRWSRRHKLPFYEDGALRIGESGAITFHLCDRHRERAVLAPEPGSDERARFDDLAFFILTELDATALYVLRRHEGLPEVYGEAPVACDAAREYFLRQIAEFDTRLADGRPFVQGGEFSALDVLLGSCLGWAIFLAMPLSETLAAYQAGLSERPAFARAMALNFPPEALAALGKPLVPAEDA